MTLFPELRGELVGAMERGPRSRRRGPVLVTAAAALVAAVIVLALKLPEPSRWTIALTVLALVTVVVEKVLVPVRLSTPVVATAPRAAIWALEASCHVIAVVPSVPVRVLVQYHMVLWLVEPSSTAVNAPGTSAQVSMPVARVSTQLAAP